jgi:hypothetical protein
MRTFLFAVLTALLFLGFAPHTGESYALPANRMPTHAVPFELAREPDYAKAKKATMRYQTLWGVCSATAIADHKVLLAKHCIEKGFAGLRLGTRTAVVVAVEEDSHDAVILTTDIYFSDTAKFGPEPKQGDIVFSHGNPASTPDMLLIGRVAGWVTEYSGVTRVMLLDRNDWFGCSGAAVFDRNGLIVGVVNAVYPWPQQGWRLTAVYPLTFSKEQMQ